MLESLSAAGLVRNFGIYVVGVAFSVVGALALAGAIEFPFAQLLAMGLAALLFASGLALVLYVHEYLGGPV